MAAWRNLPPACDRLYGGLPGISDRHIDHNRISGNRICSGTCRSHRLCSDRAVENPQVRPGVRGNLQPACGGIGKRRNSYGGFHSVGCTGGHAGKRDYLYRKSKKERREMHRMPGGREMLRV